MAAFIVRIEAAAPPQGLIDVVRNGDFIDDRCRFHCSREEAVALRDWFLARADATRSTNAVTADVLRQAATEIGEAIALESATNGVECGDPIDNYSGITINGVAYHSRCWERRGRPVPKARPETTPDQRRPREGSDTAS